VTTALAIIGGSSTLALVVTLVLVTRWGMRAKDGEMRAVNVAASELVAHEQSRSDLTATRFELVTTATALAAANARADKLAKELSDALSKQSLGAGLADGDVDGRLQKLATEAGGAADRAPPQPTVIVSDGKPAATGETIAAAVRNLHPVDDLR